MVELNCSMGSTSSEVASEAPRKSRDVDILVGFHPPQRWVSCRKM